MKKRITAAVVVLICGIMTYALAQRTWTVDLKYSWANTELPTNLNAADVEYLVETSRDGGLIWTEYGRVPYLVGAESQVTINATLTAAEWFGFVVRVQAIDTTGTYVTSPKSEQSAGRLPPPGKVQARN